MDCGLKELTSSNLVRCKGSLADLITSLERGLQVEAFRVKGYSNRGRFPEEVNITLTLEPKGSRLFLANLKVFCGRPPFYRPWVELYNIERELRVGREEVLVFAGSTLEDTVITLLSSHIGPAQPLFVEYIYDPETTRELDYGVPVAATRLGELLLRKGFTWFKLWYYPEGFMEGAPKIQAEKPINEARRLSHYEGIIAEIRDFIDRLSRDPGLSMRLIRAKSRALSVLKIIEDAMRDL